MTLVLLALPLGLATGAMLGLLGAGGSVLTVPALVYLLGQPVSEATTAALLIVSANAAVGAVENGRRGTIDVRLAAGFGAASILGALLGSYLSSLVRGETVLFLLALVMLGSAWSLWRGRPEREEARRRGRPGRIALVAGLGFSVGVLTGFFGVGGGFLIVPALVLLLDVPVRPAIGTAVPARTLLGLEQDDVPAQAGSLPDHREACGDDGATRVPVEPAPAGDGAPERVDRGLRACEGRNGAANVLEDAQPAPRPQHPPRLAERGLWIADRAENESEDHPVERVVGEGQRLGRRHDKPDPGCAPGGPLEGGAIGVDGRDRGRGWVVGQLPARSHTDLEDLSLEAPRQFAPEPRQPESVQQPDASVV